MAVLRGKIRWTIPGAGTAFTVLHFGTDFDGSPTQDDANSAVTRMVNYCQAIKNQLPAPVRLRVQQEVELIEPLTGSLLGVFSGPATSDIEPITDPNGSWAAPVGGVISWSTGGIRNGRRVRGRSFVVPLLGTTFDKDGTLGATALNQLNQAADALRANPGGAPLAVYARPTAPGAEDGSVHAVTGHRVPDMGAILTSRRS